MIRVKRIYDEPAPEDGVRVLVDRVWPRGVRKADARVDHWLKDAAPSSALRRWSGHDPARWDAFRRHYAEELDGQPEILARLEALHRDGPLTLLFAARDTEHNNAVALKQHLERRAGG